MARTLKTCLKLHGENLDPSYLSDIKKMVAANKKEGYKANEAEAIAVHDYIAILDAERAKIRKETGVSRVSKVIEPEIESKTEPKKDKVISKKEAQKADLEDVIKEETQYTKSTNSAQIDLSEDGQKIDIEAKEDESDGSNKELDNTKYEVASFLGVEVDDVVILNTAAEARKVVRNLKPVNEMTKAERDAEIEQMLKDSNNPNVFYSKNDMAGFYYDGKIYLVQENLKAGGGAIPVLLHEGGHYLLRNDKQFKLIYKGLIKQLKSKIKNDPKIKEIYDDVVKNYTETYRDALSTNLSGSKLNQELDNLLLEETLLHYIQDSAKVNQPWYKEIIAKLRTWLSRRFKGLANMSLSGYEMGMIVGHELKRSVKTKTKVKAKKVTPVLATYGGDKAKNVSDKTRAIKLEKEGNSMAEIYEETGWFKSPQDGMWRVWINDYELNMLDPNNGEPFTELGRPVSRHFADSDVFDSYPFLLDPKKVLLNITVNPETRPYANPNTERATNDSFYFIDSKGRFVIDISSTTRDGAKIQFVHEVQHLVQEYEEHAIGTNEEQVNKLLLSEEAQAYREAQRLVQGFRDQVKASNRDLRYKMSLDKKYELTEEDLETVLSLGEVQKFLVAKAFIDKVNSHKFRHNRYMSFTGEIEAWETHQRYMHQLFGTKSDRTKRPDLLKPGITTYTAKPNDAYPVKTPTEPSIPLLSKTMSKEEKAASDEYTSRNNEELSDTEMFQQGVAAGVDRATVSKDPVVKQVGGLFKSLMDSLNKSMGFVRQKDEQTTNWFTRVFSSPEYYMRRDPAALKIMNHALAEENIKHDLHNQIIGDWTKYYDTTKKNMPKEEFKKHYKAFNDYVIQVDQTGKGFAVRDRAKPETTAEKLTGKRHKYEVETWFVTNPLGKKITQEYLSEQEALDKMLELEQVALKKKGFSDVSMRFVKEHRLLTNRGFDIMVAELRRQIKNAKRLGLKTPTARYTGGDGKAKNITLGQITALMGDLRGSFVPRIRSKKTFILRAYKDEEKIAETFSMFSPENVLDSQVKTKGKRLLNTLSPIGRRLNELEQKGYEVTIDQVKAMTDVVFDSVGLLASTDALLKEAEKNISNKELSKDDTKAMQAVYNQIAQNIADVLKIKGNLSSRKQRSKYLWKGYETDINKALTEYALKIAAGEARRTTTRDMLLTLTGRDVSFDEWKKTNPTQGYKEYRSYVIRKAIDPSKQKNLYEDTRGFISFFLRPDTGADRAVGYIKAYAVNQYLGFRVSSAAINLTAMLTAAPATISAYTNIGLMKAGREITKSANEYFKYRMGLLVASGRISKSKKAEMLKPEHKKIFNWISEHGHDEPKFNQDATRAIQNTPSKAANSILNLSMYMFGATEKVNRATTIFAAAQSIIQSKDERWSRIQKSLKSADPSMQEKGFEKLMAAAVQISSQTHGTYGKAAKPWLVQRVRLLDMPYTFMKFQHNYILNMFELGFKEKQWKEVSYLLLSPGVIAGAGASLATTAAAFIAEMFGIDEPEEEFYKFVRELTGSDTLVRHGLAGLAGVNLKGSLQFNNPFPETRLEMFGAPGSVFEDVGDAVKHFVHGEYAKTAESLIPKAFGNIIKGRREYEEGLTSQSYAPIFFGQKQVHGTVAEGLARLLSFTPSRISAMRDIQWSETKIRRAFADERADILRRFKRYYVTPPENRNSEVLLKLARMTQLYNEGVYRKDSKLAIPYITNAWLTKNIKRAFTPNRYEKIRRTE